MLPPAGVVRELRSMVERGPCGKFACIHRNHLRRADVAAPISQVPRAKGACEAGRKDHSASKEMDCPNASKAASNVGRGMGRPNLLTSADSRA